MAGGPDHFGRDALLKLEQKGKTLIFCLDVSWSMLFGKSDMRAAGKGPNGGKWDRSDGQQFQGGQVDNLEHLLPGEKDRLSKCKQCLHTLFASLNPGDVVGLLCFGGEQTWALNVQEVKPGLAGLGGAIDAIRVTKTGTAFFDSVLLAASAVDQNALAKAKSKEHSNWVVALTDGDDNRSDRDARGQAGRALAAAGCNFVAITVGALQDDTLQDVKRLCGGVAPGKQGLHLVAQDADKIAQAFEEVKRRMGDFKETL